MGGAGRLAVLCDHVLGNMSLAIPDNWGWSGGVMVLGKLPVPRRPTNLD